MGAMKGVSTPALVVARKWRTRAVFNTVVSANPTKVWRGFENSVWSSRGHHREVRQRTRADEVGRVLQHLASDEGRIADD